MVITDGCDGPNNCRKLHTHNTVEEAPTKRVWSQNFGNIIDRVVALHAAKRADYTGDKSPLYNYEQAAELGATTTHRIMLARMGEKVTRLGNLLPRYTPVRTLVTPKRQVDDERIEDTLLDIANIALLILNDLEVNSG